jgi:L-alanine-DL-glutamate epimerase-like enolase superfamily enzyme
MDLRRLDSVCEAITDTTVLRLDANQAWNVEDARFLLHEFEKRKYPIDVIEQPVPAKDLDGLRWIREFSPYPVMADESLFNAADAVALIEHGAADILNIKLAKCGGFLDALNICRLAEDAGLECMLGCMMEGPVGIVAACNLAVSQQVITRVDLDCPVLYEQLPGNYSTRFEADRIVYAEADGLGIEDAALTGLRVHKLWEVGI